ncbi:MAG TPA: ACT domain-containing protein [Burkholderiales bacterium]|nr:ACT domain-containing protein [Burkholderiales bacterium]
MADVIRKVDYFSIQAADKPGEGLRYLSALREQGVNLLAFTGFPTGRRAQIDFIPEDTAALKAAAKKVKLALGARKSAFLLQGEDRAGALAETLETLAAAKINVTAMDAVTAGSGRFGAIFWVKPRDVNRAAKLLGAR